MTTWLIIIVIRIRITIIIKDCGNGLATSKQLSSDMVYAGAKELTTVRNC